jgi:hypothetical protein
MTLKVYDICCETQKNMYLLMNNAKMWQLAARHLRYYFIISGENRDKVLKVPKYPWTLFQLSFLFSSLSSLLFSSLLFSSSASECGRGVDVGRDGDQRSD